MTAAVPGQFHLVLGQCGVTLGGDGDNPDLTVGLNLLVGFYNHSWSALGVAALWIEQFHLDNPAAAERRHAHLLSERLTLFRVPRVRRSALRANLIEFGRRQRVIAGSQIFQIFRALPAIEHASFQSLHAGDFR